MPPLQRMAFYKEGDRGGYNRPVYGHSGGQPIAPDIAPLQSTMPNVGMSHPMSAPAQSLFVAPSTHNVPSSESFIPETSRTRDSAQPEDSPHTLHTQTHTASARKERRDAQWQYEAEEADRKARGLKPHVIECNSAGIPDESGKAGSRFLEVLKALCTVYLDVSIIKVQHQDANDYASLREQVDSEFEYIGHNISEEGFKKAVSKCMKAERSQLHKLFVTKPDRECPPKEEPRAWNNLKKYWNSTDFEKVSKVGVFHYHENVWSVLDDNSTAIMEFLLCLALSVKSC